MGIITDISDRLLFCKDRNVGYDLRKMALSTLPACTVEPIVLNIVILYVLLMNGTVYQMI